MNKYILDNNLILLHFPDRTKNTVYFDISIKAGSRDESRETNGLAHLTEHIQFIGSKEAYKKSRYFKEYIYNSIEASTFKERTNYEFLCHKKDSTHALPLITYLFSDTHITPSLLSQEKEVIQEELALLKSTEDYTVERAYQKNIYKKSPYALEILGSKKSLDNLTSKDYKECIKKYYTGSQTVITVHGNISLSEIKKVCQKIRKGKPQSHVTFPEIQSDTHVIQKGLSQGHYALTWKLPLETPLDGTMHWFIAELIRQPLYDSLRKEFNIYSNSTYTMTNETSTLFVIEGSGKKSNLKKIVTTAQKKSLKFLKQLDDDSLQKIKTSIATQLALEEDNPQDQIDTASYHALMYGPDNIITIDKQIDFVKKISQDDIRKALSSFEKPHIFMVK